MWEAARWGDSDTLLRLIGLGYNINETGGAKRSTPLSIATFCAHVDCMCILLDNFADVTVIDDEGDTALLKLLWMGAEVGKKFHELVHKMLQMGADPSTLSHEGVSPMSMAIDLYDHVLVRLLVENGSDISAPCYLAPCYFMDVAYTPETPLMHAIKQITGQGDVLSMVKLLIELGADLSHTIDETPLIAAIGRWRPHGLQNPEDLVRLLLDSGVPLSDGRTDEQEWTAQLEWAGLYESRTTVRWLADFATRRGKPILAAMILAEEENRERKSRWHLQLLQDMRRSTFKVLKHSRPRGESSLAEMPKEMIDEILDRVRSSKDSTHTS